MKPSTIMLCRRSVSLTGGVITFSASLTSRQLASNFETKGQYSDFKCAGLGAIIAGGWPEPVVRREFEHMGKPEIVCAAQTDHVGQD